MANTIQHKRGTASQWTTLNPLLANGELGLETDTHKFKFGDGVTYWNALDYAGGGGGDLSNYYTKAEVNNLLNEKADSFTTDYPLDLSTVTLGGVYHITVGSRIVNDYQTALTFDSNTSGVVAISNSAISNSPSTLSEFFTGNCSYFDIPTTFGSRASTAESIVNDKVWLDCGTINSSYYPMFIWGYKDTNDEFTPVVFQRAYYTGGMFSGFVDIVSNVDTNTISLMCTTYSDTSTYASGGSGVGYRATLVFKPSTQELATEVDRQSNSIYYWNGCHTQNTAILEEAKKINTVRVFAWMNGGYPPTSAEYLINFVDSGWSINDEAQMSTILSLKYDDKTITLNSNNELQALGSRNIGEIVTSTIPLTDSGLHLLDGALINGSGIYSAFVDYIANLYDSGDYPDLFISEADWQTSVTTYGVCGKFVYDSENNTVRLPKITGKLDGTTDVTALGDLVAQYIKLPNITGSFTANTTENPHYSGAIYSDELSMGGSYYNAVNNAVVKFNAARSSSVYSGNGTDTKIHEQAINVFYYIVIATTTKTDIEVDIDEIATDLNGKADIDLTNLNGAGNIKIAHNAMPSSTYVDLTLGASGTIYTAPADGYAYVKKSCPTDVYWDINLTSFDDNNNALVQKSIVRTINGSGGILLALTKNQKFTSHWYSGSGGTVNVFRFYYAVGSESEAN